MWSIESWAKLEEDFERSQKQQNKREFDEDTEYKTIFLLCDPSDSEEQEVEEEVVINKKRKVSDNNKAKKPSRDSPDFRANSRMLYNWQYQYLEEKFEEEENPDDDKMMEIANELEITLKKVKNWYYNKRKRVNK